MTVCSALLAFCVENIPHKAIHIQGFYIYIVAYLIISWYLALHLYVFPVSLH